MAQSCRQIFQHHGSHLGDDPESSAWKAMVPPSHWNRVAAQAPDSAAHASPEVFAQHPLEVFQPAAMDGWIFGISVVFLLGLQRRHLEYVLKGSEGTILDLLDPSNCILEPHSNLSI